MASGRSGRGQLRQLDLQQRGGKSLDLFPVGSQLLRPRPRSSSPSALAVASAALVLGLLLSFNLGTLGRRGVGNTPLLGAIALCLLVGQLLSRGLEFSTLAVKLCSLGIQPNAFSLGRGLLLPPLAIQLRTVRPPSGRTRPGVWQLLPRHAAGPPGDPQWPWPA